MPGLQLATKITTTEGEVTDKKLMEDDPVFKKGFMMRVTVLPMRPGEAALWLGIVPGTKESVKEEAEKKGMNEYDPRIPTLECGIGFRALFYGLGSLFCLCCFPPCRASWWHYHTKAFGVQPPGVSQIVRSLRTWG